MRFKAWDTDMVTSPVDAKRIAINAILLQTSTRYAEHPP